MSSLAWEIDQTLSGLQNVFTHLNQRKLFWRLKFWMKYTSWRYFLYKFAEMFTNTKQICLNCKCCIKLVNIFTKKNKQRENTATINLFYESRFYRKNYKSSAWKACLMRVRKNSFLHLNQFSTPGRKYTQLRQWNVTVWLWTNLISKAHVLQFSKKDLSTWSVNMEIIYSLSLK